MRPIEKRSAHLSALCLLLSTCILFPAALVAQMPTDDVLKDFKINGDYVLELEGRDLEKAEIYFSERAVAYLVMSSELASPIMISPRTRSVDSVHLMKVLKKSDQGKVDILADAQLTPVGTFELRGTEVAFSVEGRPAKLKPRPWLLGLHPGDRLREHNPEYAFKSTQYSPQTAALESLRGVSKDVRVRIYFGSWCPHCSKVVPRILRVAEDLADSKIEFEYYGLPRPFNLDPEADRVNVSSVPTAVIFVDGKETKRLDGRQLESPETAFRGALGAS